MRFHTIAVILLGIALPASGQTNLLIYKPAIKYMFKEGERK